MNTKQHLWNRLLVPAVPAFAMGGEPSPDGTEANTYTIPPVDDGEPGTTPPLDDGESNNAPEPETPSEGPENGPVTVSTRVAF